METKDLPQGYGHAGTPVPEVLGYNQTTDSLEPVTPVNAPPAEPATEAAASTTEPDIGKPSVAVSSTRVPGAS
jgi:hypothetical protein